MILSRIFTIYFFITFLLGTILFANNKYLSISYMGIDYHPNGSELAEIFPRKWDENAYFNSTVGGVVSYDVYFSKSWFVRNSISLYKDCADVLAGFLHIGIRKDFVFSKHSLSLGFGPTLMFREDWHQFDIYDDDAFFGDRVYKDYQYRFALFGGDIEYRYKINDDLELQYTIIPGYPFVIASFFGIRVKI